MQVKFRSPKFQDKTVPVRTSIMAKVIDEMNADHPPERQAELAAFKHELATRVVSKTRLAEIENDLTSARAEKGRGPIYPSDAVVKEARSSIQPLLGKGGTRFGKPTFELEAVNATTAGRLRVTLASEHDVDRLLSHFDEMPLESQKTLANSLSNGSLTAYNHRFGVGMAVAATTVVLGFVGFGLGAQESSTLVQAAALSGVTGYLIGKNGQLAQIKQTELNKMRSAIQTGLAHQDASEAGDRVSLPSALATS